MSQQEDSPEFFVFSYHFLALWVNRRLFIPIILLLSMVITKCYIDKRFDLNRKQQEIF